MLALAYVLVLAIGSMLVPLVRSVRDRVERGGRDAGARAGRGRRRDRGGLGGASSEALVTTAAREVRGRVVIVDRRGEVVADIVTRERRRGLFDARGDRVALRGGSEQVRATARRSDERILATAVPILRDGETDGAVRITQSVDAVGRAVRSATVGLVLVGLIVLAARAGRGRAAGRLGGAAAAATVRRGTPGG